ncbi:hypothetical protein JCM3765_003646 [Sporobolomyces pararoseus]
MSSANRRKNPLSSTDDSAKRQALNSFYSNFRGLGDSFFRLDLAARIAQQANLNEKDVDERYRAALIIFPGFTDPKGSTTMEPLTATRLLDDRYVKNGKWTKGERNLRFWIGAKGREHAIHEGIKLLTKVLETFEQAPPGFISTQADACYKCLQVRLEELEQQVKERQELVVFPEGSQWEPIRSSLYAYTMYAIDSEVKSIEQVLPKPKCHCCSDDASHGETAQLIRNIRSKLIAKDSAKARLKLRKAIYEALYSARLVVDNKENSLDVKQEAAKKAREEIDRIMENFIDALKAAASLRHIPISRRLVGHCFISDI